MNERREVYDLEDRESWGSGPWDGEPDRVEHSHLGYPTLLKRGPMGAWCGYVAVFPDHPWHGKGYSEIAPDVHGGITFADLCASPETIEEMGHDHVICHIPAEGKPDDVWWLGFDCGHYLDLVPAMKTLMDSLELPHAIEFNNASITYRDVAYVEEQTYKLVNQIRQVVH